MVLGNRRMQALIGCAVALVAWGVAPLVNAQSNTASESKTLSTAEVVERCDPSIAVIRGNGSVGTGFLIRPGILVTNAHVVDEEFIKNLEICFPSAPDGMQGPLKAELLFEDGQRDLAFLEVKTDLPPLAVAEKFRFRKGEDVTIIGSPGFGENGKVLENAVTRGVLSTETLLEDRKYYQLGASVNPGNSGGPVIDAYGKVIGVVTLRAVKQEALAFCIPSQELLPALDQLGLQSESDLSQLRSDHRLNVAVRLLSIAGPIHAIAMDVGLSDSRDRPQIQTVIERLTNTVFLQLREEALAVAADSDHVAEELRKRVETLSDEYRQMQELTSEVLKSRQSELSTLRPKVSAIKKAYLKDLEPLLASQKIEVPETMLAVLKSDAPNTGDNGQQVILLYRPTIRPGIGPSYSNRPGYGYQSSVPGRQNYPNQTGFAPQPGVPQPGPYQPGVPQPGVYRPGVPQPGAYRPGGYRPPGMPQPGPYRPGMPRPGQPGR